MSGLSIVGAGSLGQAFAALLAQSGQPVTLLATPATASRLHQAGCVCLRGLVSVEIPVAPAPAPAGMVGVTADPSRLPAGAGLLFMTKGHQLRAAAAAVRAVWPAADDGKAWVGGVQNGLAKDDLLAQAFGAERLVGAVTILSAERQAETQVFQQNPELYAQMQAQQAAPQDDGSGEDWNSGTSERVTCTSPNSSPRTTTFAVRTWTGQLG